MNHINSRLIFPETTDPFLNQALEEVLLISVGNRYFDFILRFWRAQPSVIIGRNQSIKAEVNIETCQKYQIPIIRRITGGGAVYLDLGCLNFSFFLNNQCKFFSRNVSVLNKFLIQIIIDALKKSNFNCTYHPSNAIFINGKKISGNAQLFKGNSVLHHGTILVNSDLKLLTKVLNTNIDTKVGRYISSKKSDVTNLNFIDRNITIEKIIQDIIIQIEKVFNLKLSNVCLTDEELNQAKSLMRKKYLNSNWRNHIA